MGLRQWCAPPRRGSVGGAHGEHFSSTSAASSTRRAALRRVVRQVGGLSGYEHQRSLTSFEGVRGGAAGDVHHPRQPRRCPLRGRPRVNGYRCVDGDVRRTTEEGVTSGGQSAIGDGLHAAEALTPGNLRQAVRGQGLRRVGPVSHTGSASSTQGSGQRRAPLLSAALSHRIVMVVWSALE